MDQEPDSLAARALKILKGDHREPSDDIVIEPAAPNARPVYWERATGEIVGPALPEFLAQVGKGPRASYWVIALYEGVPVWINSAALRNRRHFETQVKPRVVELIREPR